MGTQSMLAGWLGLWQISPGRFITPSGVETANRPMKSMLHFSLAHSQPTFPICPAVRCGHGLRSYRRNVSKVVCARALGRHVAKLQPGADEKVLEDGEVTRWGSLGPCVTAWKTVSTNKGNPPEQSTSEK